MLFASLIAVGKTLWISKSSFFQTITSPLSLKYIAPTDQVTFTVLSTRFLPSCSKSCSSLMVNQKSNAFILPIATFLEIKHSWQDIWELSCAIQHQCNSGITAKDVSCQVYIHASEAPPRHGKGEVALRLWHLASSPANLNRAAGERNRETASTNQQQGTNFHFKTSLKLGALALYLPKKCLG